MNVTLRGLAVRIACILCFAKDKMLASTITGALSYVMLRIKE